jgi:hypothetical protein
MPPEPSVAGRKLKHGYAQMNADQDNGADSSVFICAYQCSLTIFPAAQRGRESFSGRMKVPGISTLSSA